jgi:hypothetical protein
MSCWWAAAAAVDDMSVAVVEEVPCSRRWSTKYNRIPAT